MSTTVVLQQSGVRGVDSVDVAVELKFQDVPAEYAKEVSAVGYRGLTSRQLLDVYRASVTPGFIRQRQATARRDLTPEDLLELRGRRQD